MRGRTLICSLLALALCATALAEGCGGRSGMADGQQRGNPAGPSSPVAWPTFPTGDLPPSPIHRSSANSISVNGDDFAAQGGGGNYSPGTGTFVIAPGGEDKLAYAQYNIPGVTGDKPVTLSVNASSASAQGDPDILPLSFWLGVADFTTYRFAWYGPYTDSASLTLNSADERDRYVSRSGTVAYIVGVVANAPKTAANPEGLNAVKVSTSAMVTSASYQANKPHLPLISALAAGNTKPVSSAQRHRSTSALDPSQYVTIQWVHVAAFNPGDQQNEAFLYQVFRQGPLDQTPINIGSALAPEEFYVDPLDNASISAGPIPGATYQYFVRSINPNGFTPLNPAGTITVPLLPPSNVAASDGTFDDRVHLSWTKAEGATGYDIYRDGALLTSVLNVSSFDDTAVPDIATHIYTVESTNPFATSAPTADEPGSKRQAIQRYELLTGDEVQGPFIQMCTAGFNPLTNLPVASYTVHVAGSGDDATHLYEFDAVNGWQESTPIHHGNTSDGDPCVYQFLPNGDLAFLFGNTNWLGGSGETDFAVRPTGQANITLPFEQIWPSGAGGNMRIDWNGSELGLVYFDLNSSPYQVGYSHGTSGNFVSQTGTPQLTASSYWNYDFAFDSFGDPYITYVDGTGTALNLWYLHNASWNFYTLDANPCSGGAIAKGNSGKMFVLYERQGEYRLSEGHIDQQDFTPHFSDSQISQGEFLGFLTSGYVGDIVVDSQDQPHIIYPTDSLSSGDEKVRYRYRDAQGWQAPEMPVIHDFPNPGDDYQPYPGELDFNPIMYIDARYCAIALDANDKPLCVYAHDDHTLRATWFQ